ncbi:MAG: SAM-dependent methyltransferase [Polyangiales bacterium]|jgi:SAM-dependent methyltransferase
MRDPIRTDWTQRVADGLEPNPANLRDHLKQVHQDHPGFTEGCASGCRDESGRTSYEWLAEAVDPAKHRSVLDLACGSGPLLELCHQRLPEDVILTGVDMAPEELALARARLPAGRVQLIQAQAQNLDMIPEGSIDVVLCHWALTLMDPVGPVLAEMARVLAPGGRFAAIVDGPMDTAPGYAKVHDLIYGYVQAELPGYGDVDLGDPRIRDTKSLLALVRAAFPEASVEVQSNLVTMEGPAEQVAEDAAGFFYAAFVLSADRRAAMLADLATLIAGTNTPANGTFIMPINRIVVTLG